MLTLCGLLVLAMAMATPAAVAQGDDPPESSLHLAAPELRSLEERLVGWVDRLAPDQPMEEWRPGLAVAEQTRRVIVSLDAPLDLALQYRFPPDFAPGYTPEHLPGTSAAEMCGEELMGSWQLKQGEPFTPFEVAEQQARLLSESREEREHKLGWLAAYLWLHRGERDVGLGAADLLLSDNDFAERDVIGSAFGPRLLGLLPPALTAISPVEGEVALDLRVTPGFAHDSIATDEQVLLEAARRGLGAVAIAGRSQLGEAQSAERLAQRLKREGRLPADFRVIVGQYVVTRTGDVVGLFLKDRLLDGQTMSETVREIQRQGGLAYMARPGDIGAPAALKRLPFDGYLMQVGNFELFRTLLLLSDPELADKPALYASNSTVAFGTGLPHSSVPLDLSAADPLKAGLQARQGYAAGTLYFPWIMALLTKPIATYQKTLNQYFQLNDRLALVLGRWVRADTVAWRTSWDDEMKNLISLHHAWSAMHRLSDGSSPLLDYPRVSSFQAEYGRWGWGYSWELHQWELAVRWRW